MRRKKERRLREIETIMTAGAHMEKIGEERNNRNKSAWFWYNDKENKVKLEIGSSVKPDPYGEKIIKTYIHEYLENHGFDPDIVTYGLEPVKVNVLNIEMTFIDKIMAVKRHSICGTIESKSRHIYDVVRLFSMPEIQLFIQNKNDLSRVISLTKETDAFYLQKRGIPESYIPTGPFDFSVWKPSFVKAKNNYEHLHEQLLYTDEKQSFDDALHVFEEISTIFAEIGE